MNKILDQNSNRLHHSLLSYYSKGYMHDYFEKYKAFIHNEADMTTIEQLTMDIVHNEVIKIIENDNLKRSNASFINYVRDYYSKLFYSLNFNNVKDISLFYKIELFRSENATKLFDKKTCEDMRNVFIKLGNNVKRSYDSYLKDPNKLDNNSIDILFCYLTRNIALKDPKTVSMALNVARVLIENKSNRTSQNIFLYEYLNRYKCGNKHLEPAKIYISNTDLNGDNMDNIYGVSFGSTGIITMSRDLSITDKYDKNIEKAKFISSHFMKMQTLFHELQHYYQHNSLKNNELSITSYITAISSLFRNTLSKGSVSEYDLNYHFMEIERDANKVAWVELKNFINGLKANVNIDSVLLFNWGDVAYSDAYARKSNYDKTYDRYFYNVKMLVELIKTKPEEVKKYKIFKDYFIENDQIVSLETIVKRLTKMKLNHDKNESNLYAVYEDLIYAYLFHPKDGAFDFLNTASAQEKKCYYCIVGNVFEKEARKLKNMMDNHRNVLLKTNDKDEIERSIKAFDLHALHIIDRLEQLYGCIMGLSDKDINMCPEINSYLRLDKQYVSQTISGFGRTRIDECGLQASTMVDRIIDLGQLARNNLDGIYKIKYGG